MKTCRTCGKEYYIKEVKMKVAGYCSEICLAKEHVEEVVKEVAKEVINKVIVKPLVEEIIEAKKVFPKDEGVGKYIKNAKETMRKRKDPREEL